MKKSVYFWFLLVIVVMLWSCDSSECASNNECSNQQICVNHTCQVNALDAILEQGIDSSVTEIDWPIVSSTDGRRLQETDSDTDSLAPIDTSYMTIEQYHGCHGGSVLISSPETLAQFQDVECITGDLHVTTIVDMSEEKDVLFTVELPNLKAVGKDLSIGGSVTITANLQEFHYSGNDHLEVVHLPMLQSIGAVLQVIDNPKLRTLAGISALRQVNDGILIENNDVLEDAAGLENIIEIGGSLLIISNPLLADLSGFANLRFVGETLNVVDNGSLVTLSGLRNLVDVEGDGALLDIVIEGNSQLPTCRVCDFTRGLDSPPAFWDSGYGGNLTDECWDTALGRLNCP